MPRRIAPSRAVPYCVLATVLALGCGLRLYHLGTRSLWFDEAFSWRLIQFPWGEMLARAARDNNPPLYYILLKLWHFGCGDSAFGLRLLSTLFALGAMLGVYLFATEAFRATPAGRGDAALARGRFIGLLAAALVAVSAFQIRWAWDARMYALGTALYALSSWALFRALRRQSLAAWSGYGVLALMLAYTHTYALFSVAAQALFMAGYLAWNSRWQIGRIFRSRDLRGALLAWLIIALGWTPWLPVLLGQRAHVQEDYWTRPLVWSHLNMTVYQMFFDPEDPACSPPAWSPVVATLCAVALIGLALRGGAGEWYTLLAALGPIVLSIIVSLVDTNIFSLRYLVFAHVFILVAFAVHLASIPGRMERILAGIVVVGALLAVYCTLWQAMRVTEKPGARAAAIHIDMHRRKDELVVTSSPLIHYSMLFHTADRVGWRLFDDGYQTRVHYFGTAVLEQDELVAAGTLQTWRGSRVWVVNIAGGLWGRWDVRVPDGWTVEGEARFPEVFRLQGDVVVQECRLPE